MKETLYRCCSQPSGSKGCEIGVHVFSEKDPEALHSRHPFTNSEDSCCSESGEVKEGALEVCAMDCEMIYTTAGMSVARVSVVDGKGDKIFDEHVRMSEGVKVLYVFWSHFLLLARPVS